MRLLLSSAVLALLAGCSDKPPPAPVPVTPKPVVEIAPRADGSSGRSPSSRGLPTRGGSACP